MEAAPAAGRRFRLVAVVLPAVLTGSFAALWQGLSAFTALPAAAGVLITVGLALAGSLLYFHTVSRLVFRLAGDVERARAERAQAARREALADDLHDSILQTLFFLNVSLRGAMSAAQAGRAGDQAQCLADAAAATEDAYLQMRDALGRLRADGSAAGAAADGRAQTPQGLGGDQDAGAGAPAAAGGRAQTLQHLADAVGAGGALRVEIDAGSAPPRLLEPRRWAALQAILIEALRNARKHSGAGRARLWVREQAAGGSAGVADDGAGFVPGQGEGFGLPAMRRRAERAGLSLRLASAPGRGTTVEVAWSGPGEDGP